MKKTVCLLLLASTTLLGACANKTTTSNTNTASTSNSGSESASTASTSEDTTTYTVTFYGYDNELMDRSTVKKGGTAVYTNKNNPTKPDDDIHSYKFVGWDKPLTNIQADTDFYAQFETDKTISYMVYFKNPDGEVIYSDRVKVGDTPAYYGSEFSTPMMDASATNYYTFKGWDHAFSEVTDSDQTYLATYNETAYSLTYSFDTDHYIVTGTSTASATGYYVPDTYDDGTDGEHPVTTIAAGAFHSIHNEKTLFKMGKNVTTIEDKAFNIAWFSRISVEEGSIFHTSEDRHVLYKDNEVVFFGTHGIPVLCSTYTIASGATSIGNYAFYWNHDLSTLTLPDTVTAIKDYAFFNCYISSLNVGKGLTTIGQWAFSSASGIKSLALPKTLVSIGNSAFNTCKTLTTIVYEGTKEDWGKVTLGTNWRIDSSLATITCADGDITL
jgi:hypothetical protein